jgi:hypothetical protein
LITTIGKTTSCSANRNIAFGSDNRTEVSRTNVLKAVGAFSFVFLALGLTASGSIPALFFELVLGLEVFANLAPVGVNPFSKSRPAFFARGTKTRRMSNRSRN